MSLEEKFLIIRKIILNSVKGEKKFELFKAYIELKNIFVQATFSDSLFKTFDRFKNNLVYKEFELENDPEFFKGILKKIDDPSVYNLLLDIISIIKCSVDEQEVLRQQHPKFELFFEFIKLLKEESGPSYKWYSNYLSQLHGILFSEKIKYENIEWFLNSPFLKLIPQSSVSFKKSLESVFNYLVQNTDSPLTNEKVNSLKALFCFQALENKNKAKALSPIAKEALKNSLREYITPTNGFRY